MFDLHTRKYLWIDSLCPDASDIFSTYFQNILAAGIHTPVFLCIGTPLLYGDCLGPYIGTALKNLGFDHVYGTMENPVHAENIDYYRNIIARRYHKPTIIAIDAALGTKSQTGYITLRKGALRPGKAMGKNIRPIGNIEITGIFDEIHKKNSKPLMMFMSTIITQGIYKNMRYF